MEYCGILEHKDWKDNTTIWIHIWIRLFSGLRGIGVEMYVLGLYRKCLPLSKEIK